MEILILLVFVSLLLTTAFVLAFIWTWNAGAHRQGERLALLPLREDRKVDEDAPAERAESGTKTVAERLDAADEARPKGRKTEADDAANLIR
ncbi:MAG: hypothetical protein AAF355_10645 [Myxococcota bacterium]